MVALSTRQKMALANLVRMGVAPWLRVQGGNPEKHICRRRGITWELELKEGIDFSIFLFGAFEKNTIDLLLGMLTAESVVVDVGANVGAYALPLATVASRVYALEPTDWALAKLQRNLELNPGLAQKVSSHRVGILPKEIERPKSLGASWNLSGLSENESEFGATFMDTSQTEFISLDEFVQREKLARLDLLKVDVDGHDLPVLESGKESLTRFRPKIMVEYAPDLLRSHGRSRDEFFAFFADHRYQIHGDFREPPANGSRNLIFYPL